MTCWAGKRAQAMAEADLYTLCCYAYDGNKRRSFQHGSTDSRHHKLSILSPLIVIPIGIAGASNAYNMLAGYNGLEAGMGIIILGTLGYVGYRSNNSDAFALALCMAGALFSLSLFQLVSGKGLSR